LFIGAQLMLVLFTESARGDMNLCLRTWF